MIKGCIFDLDGVIVDTAGYHFKAWNRLARNLGFEFTEANNERLKGVSRMTSLDILLEVGGLTVSNPEKENLAALKNEWYLAYIDTMSPDDILPGVGDFLALLKSAGYKIGLGTASKNAPAILAQIGLTNIFDTIVDGNRVMNAKPDPEVFLLAAADLQLSPNDCVVFEDAIAGVEAAHRGGMKCIGVGQPDILIKADKIISGFVGAKLNLIEF